MIYLLYVSQVSAAVKNTEIMMSRYNIYVHAINYPTAKGEELLRIAYITTLIRCCTTL